MNFLLYIGMCHCVFNSLDRRGVFSYIYEGALLTVVLRRARETFSRARSTSKNTEPVKLNDDGKFFFTFFSFYLPSA